MHDVIVDHDWREADRVDFGTSSEVAIMRCADCATEKHVLHVKASDKSHDNPESRDEQIASLKRMGKQFEQLGETIDSQFRESLSTTRYATKENLRYDFTKRHIGVIKFEDMPFGWLKSWAAPNHRKRQLKILLGYKQGLVCNRCDRLMFSLDELTVDHIEGDRNRGQLTDLQLLCKNCNGAKGDGPPGELDVSPFKFEGETCVHRITCAELAAMCDLYENGHRTLP